MKLTVLMIYFHVFDGCLHGLFFTLDVFLDGLFLYGRWLLTWSICVCWMLFQMVYFCTLDGLFFMLDACLDNVSSGFKLLMYYGLSVIHTSQ